MATIKSFEELDSWQKARRLCYEVFKVSSQEPFCRDFALKDQILRASGSVMDNIAEGFGRGGNKEFVQFLFYAKGSCVEVKSQLYRAKDRGYLNEETFQHIFQLANEIESIIQGTVNYLKRSGIVGHKFK